MRRANDGCVKRTQEAVQLIDVGTLARSARSCAKTEMMQADAPPLECGTGMLGRRRVDSDRPASADVAKLDRACCMRN